MPPADDGAWRGRDHGAGFRTAVDEPERFPSSAAVGAYFGLVHPRGTPAKSSPRRLGPYRRFESLSHSERNVSKNTLHHQLGADASRLDVIGSLLLRADPGSIRYREFESSTSANTSYADSLSVR